MFIKMVVLLLGFLIKVAEVVEKNHKVGNTGYGDVSELKAFCHTIFHFNSNLR